MKKVTLSRKGLFGLVLGFFGVYLLVFPSSGTVHIDVVGIVLIIIASISWALGSVLSTTVKSDSSIITHIGIQMLAASIGLFLAAVIRGEFTNLHFTVQGSLAIGYLIVFGSIIGFSSYIYILSKWPATKASTYAYVNPVVAVILGYIILGEKLSLVMVISMVIILVGVFLVQNSKVVYEEKYVDEIGELATVNSSDND